LADNYIDYLEKEWALYTKAFPLIKINSIHLGGGTPSFLTDNQLQRLLSIFENYKSLKFSGNIELDPRTVNNQHIKILKILGFTMLVLGIQDFNKMCKKPSIDTKTMRWLKS
jgi:oxygen-independent coproporphyrinogen-3 oxidase